MLHHFIGIIGENPSTAMRKSHRKLLANASSAGKSKRTKKVGDMACSSVLSLVF